jgi:hypothetical protein
MSRITTVTVPVEGPVAPEPAAPLPEEPTTSKPRKKTDE